MADATRDSMLLVASDAELPASQRVWGTGGWLPPEQREALDWLTLAALSGWSVAVTRPSGPDREKHLPNGSHWIVLGCDPDRLEADWVHGLASRLSAEPLLVVARAGTPESPWARLAGVAGNSERFEGRALAWSGPGPEHHWHARRPLEARALCPHDATAIWATLEGSPVIVARRVGLGRIATVGFHPSQARDADGVATALFKHLLIWGSELPLAWFDWDGCLILRMDDPGGAQNVYSRNWSYPKLGKAQWTALADDLSRRNARLSIGYVSGWVDDGDAKRGMLQVAGEWPNRVAGRVHDSSRVKYQDLAGHAPGSIHDYEAEFQGIQTLRAAGLGEVELHGCTHLHPDTVAWARAPDRYDAVNWYRELGNRAATTIAARPPQDHPLALGMAGLRRSFGVIPTTLICPGDDWTNAVLERALELGLRLVSSYYQALRIDNRFCWCTHCCAPYLDQPDRAWFDAGLPVVGYFHDREPALLGIQWVCNWLDQWQAAGAQRLMDFREWSAAVGRGLRLQERPNGVCLHVINAGAPSLVRPLPVTIRVPKGHLPSRLSVQMDERDSFLEVQRVSDSVGQVTIFP
ncbi:MAG TPA: hypothetical protein VKU02_08280 [Gemmataceae bacterium]|nr:hypothetical protein [Gemmataceae bacterium]